MTEVTLRPSTTPAPRTVVVVGASAAGLATSAALRRGGFAGRLTLLSAENVLPYDRPPLSKRFLDGTWSEDRLQLMSTARLESLGVDLRLGVRATALDVAGGEVHDDQGVLHPYDAVVVATGLRPRTLPGTDLLGMHVLRSLQDAQLLRKPLADRARLTVVGAGFLGLEVAATARSLGCEVTVTEPVQRPLAARLGEHGSERLLNLHRERGVDVRSGTGVIGFRSGPNDVVEPYSRSSGEPGRPHPVSAVELTDGTVVPTDAVLLAIGCQPCTDWLTDSGLSIDDGVVCDEYCRAAPGVWAAGDIARWLHLDLGRHVRLEHRTNATEQGAAVAAGILGGQAAYRPVPFFWTDHYDVRIQVVGTIPEGASAEVVFGDPDGDSFVMSFSDGPRLVGGLAWNAPRAMVDFRRRLSAEEAA